VTYEVTGMKNLEKVKCVHIIKCAKVRALFDENKVCFARAEQLWSTGIASKRSTSGSGWGHRVKSHRIGWVGLGSNIMARFHLRREYSICVIHVIEVHANKTSSSSSSSSSLSSFNFRDTQ